MHIVGRFSTGRFCPEMVVWERSQKPITRQKLDGLPVFKGRNLAGVVQPAGPVDKQPALVLLDHPARKSIAGRTAMRWYRRGWCVVTDGADAWGRGWRGEGGAHGLLDTGFCMLINQTKKNQPLNGIYCQCLLQCCYSSRVSVFTEHSWSLMFLVLWPVLVLCFGLLTFTSRKNCRI